MRAARRCIFGLAMLSGCAGTETGNPERTQKLGLTAVTSRPDIAAIGDSQGGLGIESAWASLNSLRSVGCESATESVVADDVVADLIGGADDATVPSGYCGLRAEHGPVLNLPPAAPAELADNSLFITGTRSDGVRFVLFSRTVAALNLISGEPHIDLSSLGPRLVLGFNLATLFESVLVQGAVLQVDGSIRIDEHSNADLLATFDSHVLAAVGLYVDGNDNGHIDPEELTPVADHRP